jgi:hypothetical protein
MSTTTIPEPEVRDRNGGTQRRYKFPNGYGASVVCGPYTYGGSSGLWELAVLDRHQHLTYDTPITDDVIGYLDAKAVTALLVQIAALPEAPQ